MKIKKFKILFYLILVLIPVSVIWSQIEENDIYETWEYSDYGYHPYRPTPEYCPEFQKSYFYRQLNWDYFNTYPEFSMPVSNEERYFCHYLWKVFTDLNDTVYRAEYYVNGIRIYYILYYYHDYGIVIKMLYQYTPEYNPSRVFFYDEQKNLNLIEFYNIEGRLDRVYYAQDRRFEIMSPNNFNPYRWASPQ